MTSQGVSLSIQSPVAIQGVSHSIQSAVTSQGVSLHSVSSG